MNADTYVLVVPAPAPWIRSNDHTHWRKRHTLTAAWRTRAAWAAKVARLPAIPGPVHVTGTIHRENARVYDLDGVVPTLKACVDGCRDAGVLAGDDFRAIPVLTVRAGEPWADAALVLTITPLREDAP